MSSLPETIDRETAVDVITREFDLSGNRISQVHFEPDALPAATVTVRDLDLSGRVCQAVGIDLTGVRTVTFDDRGAVVVTIDGDAHRIPFGDTLGDDS